MSDANSIVSLLSASTEILYALGLGDRVVATSHECDWPPAALSKLRVTYSNIAGAALSGDIDRQVHEMYQAGRPLYGIDEEALATLRPDLIVTQSQCEVCAISYQDVMSLVRSSPQLAQTKVVALNPNSLNDVFEDIRRIAQAAAVPAVGESYITELKRRIDAVRQHTARLSLQERPRVCCIEWLEPLMLAGNWTPELVEIAGGACPLVQAGAHSPYVTWEAISAFDPQVVVVSPCGFDLARTMKEAQSLKSLPGWSTLTAVQTGSVYAADGNALFNRSGPRLIDTLELLGHLIHPDLLPAPAVAGLTQAWSKL